MPKCPVCSGCKLKKQCKFSLWEKIYEKLEDEKQHKKITLEQCYNLHIGREYMAKINKKFPQEWNLKHIYANKEEWGKVFKS